MRTSTRKLFDRKSLVWTAWLTVVIELVTIVLRFGFGKDSASATASTIGVLTFGIRVHHGYVGLILFLFGLAFFENRPKLGQVLVIVGGALFLSDMIHHFLVLWPVTGSPQFDLVYPE